MKAIALILFLLSSYADSAQVISTFAGGGGGRDGSPASVARLTNPTGLALDNNHNLYVADNLGHQVRVIDSNGIIHTIAGTGTGGYNGDNIPATSAHLNQPVSIVVNTHGHIFFTDNSNYRIRKIDPATGLIYTICGNGTATSTGDGGPATSATLGYPHGLCIDKYDNIYVADLFRVRKIDTAGIITTVAGRGIAGERGDGGPATAALVTAQYVDIDDSGYVYITSYVVRKVDPHGIITTIAGDSSNQYYNGDNIPATAARLYGRSIRYQSKSKLLYICDGYNDRVRVIDSMGIIHTFAGNGTNSYTGDGGRPDTAGIDGPVDIIFDGCGNAYISQVNPARIRKVTFDASCNQTDTSTTLRLEQASTAQPSMDVYPNPATTYFHVTGLSPAGGLMQVYDLSGRLLQQQVLTGPTPVNIASLLPGTYQVVITDTATHKRQAVRLVKE